MIRIFADANYDFIGLRKYAYGVSAAILAVGIILLSVYGLNYSIEFTGGTLIQLHTTQTVDANAVRNGLDPQGIPGAETQAFGGPTQFVILSRRAHAGSRGPRRDASCFRSPRPPTFRPRR